LRYPLCSPYPLAIGTVLRSRAPQAAARWRERLQLVALLLLLTIVGSALWLQRAIILATLPDTTLAALGLIGLALALGKLTAVLLYSTDSDHYAVMTEFTVRNLAVGLFVAVGVQGNYASAVPALVYLLLETTVLVGLSYRRRQRSRPGDQDASGPP
jgi:predicted Na+-dependent transporter